jgi:hypothetical protein
MFGRGIDPIGLTDTKQLKLHDMNRLSAGLVYNRPARRAQNCVSIRSSKEFYSHRICRKFPWPRELKCSTEQHDDIVCRKRDLLQTSRTAARSAALNAFAGSERGTRGR